MGSTYASRPTRTPPSVRPSGSGKSTIVGLIEGWYTLHDQYIIAKTIEKDKKKKKEKKSKKGKKDSPTIPMMKMMANPRRMQGYRPSCGAQGQHLHMWS